MLTSQAGIVLLMFDDKNSSIQTIASNSETDDVW
jgi:hypothetical protein